MNKNKKGKGAEIQIHIKLIIVKEWLENSFRLCG